MHKLFFDLETGGLNPEKDTILTAYFGIYNDNLELIDELDLKLKPDDLAQLSCHPEALKVTGINLEQHLQDPKTINYTQGRDLLLGFLGKYKIKGKRRHFRPCGQNLTFDLNFLHNQFISQSDWDKLVHYNPIDTLRILTFLQDIEILPDELGSLTSLVKHFQIPQGLAHNAKEDVKMTVEVYRKLSELVGRLKTSSTGISSDLLSIIED